MDSKESDKILFTFPLFL